MVESSSGFYDRYPLRLEERINVLEVVLHDVYQVTGGRVSAESFKQARKVLDLGMGRGAFGGVIRKISPQSELIGVDVVDYPERNLYSLYARRIINDVTGEEFWEQLKGIYVDLAIGIGLPDQVNLYLINSVQRLVQHLNPAGAFILLSDLPYEGNWSPFAVFQGKRIIDRSIFLLQFPKVD